MSIEYFGTPTPALTTESIQQVVDSMAQMSDIHIVRQDESEFGIGFPENQNFDEETATMMLKPEQVYVAFHACHLGQREKVVQFLESTMETLGFFCQLDEE